MFLVLLIIITITNEASDSHDPKPDHHDDVFRFINGCEDVGMKITGWEVCEDNPENPYLIVWFTGSGKGKKGDDEHPDDDDDSDNNAVVFITVIITIGDTTNNYCQCYNY